MTRILLNEFTIGNQTIRSCILFFVKICSFLWIHYWKWNLMSIPPSKMLLILLLNGYFYRTEKICSDIFLPFWNTNKYFHWLKLITKKRLWWIKIYSQFNFKHWNFGKNPNKQKSHLLYVKFMKTFLKELMKVQVLYVPSELLCMCVYI